MQAVTTHEWQTTGCMDGRREHAVKPANTLAGFQTVTTTHLPCIQLPTLSVEESNDFVQSKYPYQLYVTVNLKHIIKVSSQQHEHKQRRQDRNHVPSEVVLQVTTVHETEVSNQSSVIVIGDVEFQVQLNTGTLCLETNTSKI